jgi:hypothetical protein
MAQSKRELKEEELDISCLFFFFFFFSLFQYFFFVSSELLIAGTDMDVCKVGWRA